MRGSNSVRTGFLMLALLAASTANEARADQNCQIPGFRFNITSEGPWPARMSVTAGKSCGSRRWSFGSISPNKLYLVNQAKHGQVTLSHPGGYRYAAAGGYAGPDSFTLRLCGTSNGGYQGCTNIQFEVSVVARIR
jgi:hypothetical protein